MDAKVKELGEHERQQDRQAKSELGPPGIYGLAGENIFCLAVPVDAHVSKFFTSRP